MWSGADAMPPLRGSFASNKFSDASDEPKILLSLSASQSPSPYSFPVVHHLVSMGISVFLRDRELGPCKAWHHGNRNSSPCWFHFRANTQHVSSIRLFSLKYAKHTLSSHLTVAQFLEHCQHAAELLDGGPSMKSPVASIVSSCSV